MNTLTGVTPFLIVFLLQSTQNRDTEALQLKIDELIRATQGAHTELLDLEELDQEQLDKFRDKYEELARQAREKVKRGGDDTDTPEVKKDMGTSVAGNDPE